MAVRGGGAAPPPSRPRARPRRPPALGGPARRWALYVGALLVGMVGFIAPFVYRAPQNVRVGVTALRIGTVYLMLIVTGVCVAIPALLALATG